MEVKNWLTRQRRPLMLSVLAPKPLLAWLTARSYHGLKVSATYGFPWMHLSSGLKIRHILRLAWGQRCVIRKENANA